MRRALLLAGIAALTAIAAPANAAPCDEKCLLKLADRTVEALAKQDWRSLPWSDPVRYSEGGVSLMIGDAIWGSAGATPGKKAFAVADPASGNVVWFGTLYDHDAPAFGAIRIKADEGKIAEIEFIVARKGMAVQYGDPTTFTLDPRYDKPIPAAARETRDRLADIADAYLATKQRNDGTLFTGFTPDCEFKENGISETTGSAGPAKLAQGCEAQLKLGLYRPIERIRERRFPVIDPARGLVVAISLQDWPLLDTKFTTSDGRVVPIGAPAPMSRLNIELIRIEDGKIARSEGVTVPQPLNMPSAWRR